MDRLSRHARWNLALVVLVLSSAVLCWRVGVVPADLFRLAVSVAGSAVLVLSGRALARRRFRRSAPVLTPVRSAPARTTQTARPTPAVGEAA